jgi:hypothetical protein
MTGLRQLSLTNRMLRAHTIHASVRLHLRNGRLRLANARNADIILYWIAAGQFCGGIPSAISLHAQIPASEMARRPRDAIGLLLHFLHRTARKLSALELVLDYPTCPLQREWALDWWPTIKYTTVIALLHSCATAGASTISALYRPLDTREPDSWVHGELLELRHGWEGVSTLSLRGSLFFNFALRDGNAVHPCTMDALHAASLERLYLQAPVMCWSRTMRNLQNQSLRLLHISGGSVDPLCLGDCLNNLKGLQEVILDPQVTLEAVQDPIPGHRQVCWAHIAALSVTLSAFVTLHAVHDVEAVVSLTLFCNDRDLWSSDCGRAAIDILRHGTSTKVLRLDAGDAENVLQELNQALESSGLRTCLRSVSRFEFIDVPRMQPLEQSVMLQMVSGIYTAAPGLF